MFNILENKDFETKVKILLENNIPNELKPLKENNLFKGKAEEIYDDLNYNNEGFIYLGLGSNDVSLESVRMTGFKLGKLLSKRKINDLEIDLKDIEEDKIEALIEGLADSQYNFDHYKSKKKEKITLNISFKNTNIKIVETTINLMKGVFKTRDLVNLTPIDLYPESYAKLIEEEFKNSDVSVTVLNKSDLEKLNMHALLTVGKGSNNEPKFVVLKYMGNKNQKEHKTIVGKGVTYDSGGYAIKPAGSMASMKSDMAGSATVVGLMKALNENKPKVNVVGVMALAENLISGKAYKNGDVINTMKGLTVEVINTDAEGRLTLADAIYYAATKLNSTEIVEISTLTGACVVALGNHITGITTENDDMYNKIHEAGLKAGEFNWRMPMTTQLKESVKSDIADLKNAVAGGGGMMTAGIFLNNFNEDVPFMHLDIAGPSFSNSAYKHIPKGASGVKVKTLYNYILK